MVNVGTGEKHWTVSSAQDEGQRMKVVLESPVLSEDGSLSAHVLYLPPHFFHEVESEPNSLAVHTFFMPRLLHQHPDATIWATSSGAQEQAKVLPAKYDKWKRENHISERHVKEGGGGKGGGGGNKRARDGDAAADMEAPSKKPAAAQVTAEAEKPAAQVTAEEAEAMSLLPPGPTGPA